MINPQRSSYRLLGMVGNGQFGRVYCGVHRKTGQLVAIKYLHRHSLPTHAFLRELHCLLSLDHPNIVACHALEHWNEGRLLVLEYCVGGTLRSHMLSPLSTTDILSLVSDILSGLAHAHQRGIIHCDIKPENILLSYYDGRWRAKISDFGIAKLVEDQPNRKGSGQTGSPAYMAPERFYCQYSPAADVYAVGVILFELLLGKRPFSGNPIALQSAHLNEPVPKINQLADSLKRIITKALEKLPARRYPTAQEMLADLQSLQQPEHLPVRVETCFHPYSSDPFYTLSKPVVQMKTCVPTLANPLTEVSPTVLAQGFQLAIVQDQSVTFSQQLLDSPVRALYPGKSGLIINTDYTLWHSPDFKQLVPVTRWQAPSLVAIESNARWLAAVTPSTQRLTIVYLHTTPVVKSYPAVLCADLNVDHVMAVDSGHLAIVGRQKTQSGTQLQLWNRRGMCLNSQDLGITLKRFTPTSQSQQWMAVDAHDPYSVIFLSLKPLRMTRLILDICPVLMFELPWGYLFSDSQGRMQLLDRDYQSIGGIEGPVGMTAITPINSQELLLATWQQAADLSGKAELHQLNLQEFELDMIF